MNKEGLSTIVATLIIILLAIVAFGIISVVVKNFVSKSAEDIEFEAAVAGVDVRIEKVSVGSVYATVKVFRTGGEKLTGLKFVFISEKASQIIERDVFNFGDQEIRTFRFETNEFTNLKINEIINIAIYPEIEFRGGERYSNNPSFNYPITEPLIVGEEIVVCNDADKDGYCLESSNSNCDKNSTLCEKGWDDCNDNNVNINPGFLSEKICNDDFDNDCDGFSDCADPDCATNKACIILVPKI